MVRHLIETYWKDVHLRHGYELIYSPHIAKVKCCSCYNCWSTTHLHANLSSEEFSIVQSGRAQVARVRLRAVLL